MRGDKPYDPGDDLTILVSGVECCVCGKTMRGLSAKDRPHLFQVKQVIDLRTRKPMNLYCCGWCKHEVNEVGRYGNWKKLPPGPLRRAFEDHEKELRRKA